jgi:hypothetical protein
MGRDPQLEKHCVSGTGGKASCSVELRRRDAMDDRTVDLIFAGSLESLPPVSSKIVRIFTSSTFTGQTRQPYVTLIDRLLLTVFRSVWEAVLIVSSRPNVRN